MAYQFLDSIGSTPLLRPDRFLQKYDVSADILVKYEGANPAGSIKDRAALNMIDEAERSGKISVGGTIIEATSGNTGIGLALVCAQRGYELILTMPESMSIERRSLLKAMGAKLMLTPADRGMQGAVEKANELAGQYRNAFIVRQFSNPANSAAHYLGTAPEIWEQTEGKIDILVATIGSGGTISGCGKFFKEKDAGITVIGVEPEESPLLTKGYSGPHIIQGIGANFVPGILDKSVIDQVVTVKGDDAVSAAKTFGTAEGITVGISSGAALFAALSLAAKNEFADKKIVAILPDRGERYMSTKLFDFGE